MECIDNHLLYTIKTRRSIRKYTDEPLPENALRHILLAGMYSPSSRNRRPWEFILVNDPDMLKKMSGCRVGSAKMLEHAKAAIVVIGNPEVSDVWIEDCSVVMYGMHLMADYLGVGSCWIQCRLRQAEDGSSTKEYLRHLLHFPENFEVEAILSLGMPEQHPQAPDIIEELLPKLHHNKY
ncbi:MAG: nitroreductase family protein [Lachnospiraceae bacterium]|uniref:Nitroreductase family protein n=1 Tax=Hominifimenecus microfluidus TaxID=2885348 RepID=A0AAE3ED78_9FIRM|nr:nitroreductase family protein [Hominifimenecus microfluidus]MCC2232784.1 nitroreductase family protein [Hominifimenecus microfluidus]